MMVEADGIKSCVGWMYRTDSSICIFEFVLSNPDISKDKRDAALTFLIDQAKEWATQNGFSLVFAPTAIPRYEKRLEDAGFKFVDKQSHLFYEVKR